MSTLTSSVRPLPAVIAAVAIGVLLLSACTGETAEGPAPTDGDPATWQLTSPNAVTPGTRSLDIEVTRLACSSGKTGGILEPTISYESSRVVIQVDAALQELGSYLCLGNDSVATEVELDEDIGGRELVDGACLDGEAATTAECQDPVRWDSE